MVLWNSYVYEEMCEVRNILIVQLGDIGDVVWAIPSFLAVKEAHPQAKVSLLLREGIADLLAFEPSVHKVFSVPKRSGNLVKNVLSQLLLIMKLRKEKFDMVIDQRSDDRGAIMTWLAGAPVRIGQYYSFVPFWRNLMFTHLIDPPPLKERNYGAAEQTLRILRGMGIIARNTIPKIVVHNEILQRSRNILTQNSCFTDNEKRITWITINPFSRWAYKEWAYDKWGKIIDWLWEEFSLTSVIVGAPSEKMKARELVQSCSGHFVNLVGQTTLAELAGVLKLSGLHIGVDSAAPHIAAAVGTPTVTIYGPSDWREWAPIGENHRVVVPLMECVPCHKKGCGGSERSLCLETLEVGEVKRVVHEALKKELG